MRKDKWIFWLLVTALSLTFIILIKSILLPFVVAFIVAYFLDPVVDKMEAMGFSRLKATGIIVLLFFVLMLLAGIFLLPIFAQQLISFIQHLPEYSDYIHYTWLPKIMTVLDHFDPNSVTKAKEAMTQFSGTMFAWASKLIGNLWASGMAMVNILSLLFITPIVTFYALRDFDRMIATIYAFIPPKHAPVFREQALLIDRTLSGYIRGQTNVCLILGVFYAIALTFADIQFGIFIGLGTGILTFIPYVGILFGLAVGILVAFFQYGDILHLGLVIGIFVIGQIIEGNFITPKLVGDRVGLHPVWIIFGMLSGAALFGFTGVLLAVPVTAIIGVLVRFFLNIYLKSNYYHS